MARRAPAADVARWQHPTRLWLDHAVVADEDLEWMAPVQSLLLWNVRLPDGALARLPNLAGVSLRGGTGETLDAVRGCDSLVLLDVNQIRGLHDLSALEDLRALEFLSLYGLPRVERLPSLAHHDRLARVQLGSLKGLTTLEGLLNAPSLRSLELSRRVALTADDVAGLAGHPTLAEFGWFDEDVPRGESEPVRERLSHLGRPTPVRPEAWLDGRLGYASA